ncbi:2Fe-2S iron-sulfur cluster-binding protein [Cyanobium sp. WAJ14-Wanaka]|uniref:2Fe-2S iron-sulfur cluster-binding protein n=1 Tax=Cyanobium sp. WAJ14-Wanaka TaxID=2823725 RepID=UPI0020CCA9E4|nr:2Fe-2S iron-sulfur cluster-binding protein [Cyanobium sp. WAJ14-Wanaka]MCP9774847.1 2Fe-2S iron-sulfur cluster binding domain-containing protein [Cyanobium sp. WAJ14-Wanaka]
MAAGTIATFAALTLLPADHKAAENGKVSPDVQALSGLRQTADGAAVGALAGLLLATAAQGRRRRAPWQGWRQFVVVRKQRESAEITSFELRPVGGGPLPKFLPGQFLTLQLPIPGMAKPVVRTYSLSDFPSEGKAPDHYRISVKREPAPKGLDVAPGLGSNFLHDHGQEGSKLNIRPPAGSFVLDTESTEPVVLVSNGVGITPMLAMVKAALSSGSQRPIWFLHGCRNSEYHSFQTEIADLARSHNNLQVHVAYSRPLPSDGGCYQSQGYIDGALISGLIKGPASYYLCGSPAFMDSLVMALQQAGVGQGAIRFESFSQAPRVSPSTGAGAEGSTAPVASSAVRFCRSNTTATWSNNNPEQSLLELAEASGLQPAFACRAGVCGTCITRVKSGSINYLAEPTAEVAPGSALICIARPASETLELEQ